MTLVWLAVLIVSCFTPSLIYFAVTKKSGGEPLILKGKEK